MQRLLIANRGEIALRILRACRQAAIEVVAAYSRVDEDLRHLDLSDDTVCIGRESYMDGDQLLAAAISRGCDAIHPGYGFLSENAEFAARAESEGLKFVGPTSEQIRVMGNKSEARQLLVEHGVPVLPGSAGTTDDYNLVREVAVKAGFPVLLKASHGGGGRGICRVGSADELEAAYLETTTQALNYFGNGELYVEKYLSNARHIEIQVAGDGRGQVISLGARDCSVQRRHQKLIEEAPPPGIDDTTLQSLSELCCSALANLQYRNLGTLEFLYQDGCFYFIEMNTRLQVEHPVTEEITGLDLVALQLEIAGSGSLPITQSAVRFEGHAIECRINAEDADFNPSPGKVTELRWPGGPGVRLDSHLYEGYRIPHHYDSLVGKLICTGNDRGRALSRMRSALDETRVGPVATNISLHREILREPGFLEGGVSTGYLESIVLQGERS
ncbi:MAG: ATP-grasp domain-containing protein [Pseudomonadales bacterium]|jgi:acetyl-CoA carboxylase biotin carboxylase subunit|nr:ATP-grasp domain-containing protein [Pseudomonadales bacterium]